MGRSIQAAYEQAPQVVLTVPLLTGIDGAQKMSKSFGNQVGITEEPEEMYGRTMRIPDPSLGEWWDLLLGAPVPEGVGPRDAKRALARALVERFHGAPAAPAAEAAFDRVHVQRALPDEVEEAAVAADGGIVHLPELVAALFGGSRSEARRKIAQGGVRLDGEPVRPETLDVPAEELDGRVLQVGKRQFRRLRVG
jgi:tyrosyl-tRNA synthetase